MKYRLVNYSILSEELNIIASVLPYTVERFPISLNGPVRCELVAEKLFFCILLQ